MKKLINLIIMIVAVLVDGKEVATEKRANGLNNR